MRRLRNDFNISADVNFAKVYFVNSGQAFFEHPSRHTTTIRRVIENRLSQYHHFDVRIAYINGNLDLAINVTKVRDKYALGKKCPYVLILVKRDLS